MSEAVRAPSPPEAPGRSTDGRKHPRFRYTRAELQAATPPSYRLWKHASLIALFTLAFGAVAVSRLEPLGAGDGLFVLGVLLFTNFGEWAVHRTRLHHPGFPHAVYHRHVIEHHAFFTYETMAVDSSRDLRWVLFPPWALPLLVATNLPFFLLLQAFAPASWPWLFLLSVVGYYGIYEVFHAAAHLPAGAPLAGNRLVRAITYHHRVHHDPRLMSRWNFNFAIPVFDWLFGTLHPKKS